MGYSLRWNNPLILTFDPNFLGHPSGSGNIFQGAILKFTASAGLLNISLPWAAVTVTGGIAGIAGSNGKTQRNR